MQVSMIEGNRATLRFYALKTLFLAGGVAISCFYPFSGIHAQEVNLVPMSGISDAIISDPNTSLALFGYDPVAYFIDGKAVQGQKQFEVQIAGLMWRFSNEGNFAAFTADPKIYSPQFGGYDPVSITKEQIVGGNPTVFLTLDGELYLFRDMDHKRLFENNKSLQAAAKQKWPYIKSKLVRPH